MAGLAGGGGVMERVVAAVGWMMVMVDVGAICWVVIMLVVVVLVDMGLEVDMDTRLGHCSAATRDAQRRISRLRDCFLRLSLNDLLGSRHALVKIPKRGDC